MQKNLPKIASKYNFWKAWFVPVVSVFLVLFFFLVTFHAVSFAQDAPAATSPLTVGSTTPSPTLPADSVSPSPADGADSSTGSWKDSPEVTFVGKTGVRSGDFLTWALYNYDWICVQKVDNSRCDNSNNPLVTFWVIIRNIVYAMIALFVLGTAFIIIVTRGQNITVMRFIPRFIFIVVLITLSYSLVQFIYQVADIIQGFFLKVGTDSITAKNLLYLGFDYSFKGFRLIDDKGTYDESAFISLLLVRLTAITYYVMTGVLLIRKIILWFFIIISPVFPLLLFYKPIRNTAKVWVGEFFRWLLYAPLFAIFLHGLVLVWQSKFGIPLAFDYSKAVAGEVVYPTAINILLGGPGQKVFYHAPDSSNSVNLSDTFALYVVALLMLWVVIILPFILLKIFLDYLNTISFGNNVGLKQFMNKNFSFLSPGSPPGSPSSPPGSFQPAGVARSLPFLSHGGATAVKPVAIRADVQASVRESADVLKLTNLSIPKMRDIARYETSMLSTDKTRSNETSQLNNTLTRIANPNISAVPSEREKFSTVRQQLLSQKQKGNPIASSILNASQLATSTNSTSVSNTSSAAAVQSKVASSILNASQISTSTTSAASRPQQVSQLSQTLTKISNPGSITVPAEKEKYEKIKETLIQEKAKGDRLATSILDVSEKINKAETSGDQKALMEAQILDGLLAKEKTERIEAQRAAGPLGTGPRVNKPNQLPVVNHVQQVSLDDYEEVRKLWTENYQTIEPPKGISGTEVTRRDWIKNDMDKITQAIALLNSAEPEKVNQGMEMVANILPFLLIGGFSKSEVVAYLKAKMEAGKQVMTDLEKREKEEDSMVGVQNKPVEQPKEMSQSMEQKTLEDDADPNVPKKQ